MIVDFWWGKTWKMNEHETRNIRRRWLKKKKHPPRDWGSDFPGKGLKTNFGES